MVVAKQLSFDHDETDETTISSSFWPMFFHGSGSQRRFKKLGSPCITNFCLTIRSSKHCQSQIPLQKKTLLVNVNIPITKRLVRISLYPCKEWEYPWNQSIFPLKYPIIKYPRICSQYSHEKYPIIQSVYSHYIWSAMGVLT